MSLLRQPLLLLARSQGVKKLATTLPVSSGIVASYVPGESTEEAVDAAARLVDAGLSVSLDHLGEDISDARSAQANVDAYLELLDQFSARGLSRNAEVSLKLSSIGQSIPRSGHKVALDNARTICHAARNAGTTVTLDMEGHTTTDATLQTLGELRKDFPETGAVLQAALRRTESDCRALAHEGSRVRLCKGAYREPASVAFQERLEVDKSFVRCLKVLMRGNGYPMIATHDPRMIAIASSISADAGREKGAYEFQMLFGVRPEEQKRLAASGERVRVYVPYGREWYAYLMRRLAERPQNLSFFVKSLVSKK